MSLQDGPVQAFAGMCFRTTLNISAFVAVALIWLLLWVEYVATGFGYEWAQGSSNVAKGLCSENTPSLCHFFPRLAYCVRHRYQFGYSLISARLPQCVRCHTAVSGYDICEQG